MKVKDSNRLRFQLMTAKDSELMYQLDQDPEVMHFINGGNLTSKKDIKEVYIPRMQSYTNAEQGWGIWKVVLKQDETFIGWILVRPMAFFSDSPEYDNLELGWRFHRNSWGKGYASEAAESIKQALVKLGKTKQFSAIAIEDNFASINIMRKLGMTFIKKYIYQDPLGDQEVVYYKVDT